MESCIGCRKCMKHCPQKCIEKEQLLSSGRRPVCTGNCYESCPVKAVIEEMNQDDRRKYLNQGLLKSDQSMRTCRSHQMQASENVTQIAYEYKNAGEIDPAFLQIRGCVSFGRKMRRKDCHIGECRGGAAIFCYLEGR